MVLLLPQATPNRTTHRHRINTSPNTHLSSIHRLDQALLSTVITLLLKVHRLASSMVEGTATARNHRHPAVMELPTGNNLSTARRNPEATRASSIPLRQVLLQGDNTVVATRVVPKASSPLTWANRHMASNKLAGTHTEAEFEHVPEIFFLTRTYGPVKHIKTSRRVFPWAQTQGKKALA